MTDPITLTPTLRVRDYDAQQYVIELHRKDDIWTVVAFVGLPRNLPEIARRYIGGDAALKARLDAEVEFDMSGLPAVLAALPDKGKSK